MKLSLENKIAQSFNRVASKYEQYDQLQQTIGELLLERLQWLKVQPSSILDVGSGTGRLTHTIAIQYQTAQIYAIDIALQMAKQTRKKLPLQHSVICGDATQLPLADSCIDLIISNLMLQWCQHPEIVFAEFARVLKPQGTLFFSTFGPGTLKELRHSWMQVDDNAHVNDFIEMHDLGDILLQVGLRDPVVDREYFENQYETVQSLMKYLKNIGAQFIIKDKALGLTGKNKFKAMIAAYENYRTAENQLPATFEVIYGHALGRNEMGETRIPLSQLQRHRSL